MAGYTKAIVIGNIVRDLELRDMPSGSKVLDFSVAVNRKYKSKDGEAGEESSFVDISAFGRTAENIAKYHKKGDPIFIEGRLKQDRWESKEGQKRSKLSVVAERFEFQNSGKRDEGQAPAPSAPPEPLHSPTNGKDDDNLPF